MSKEAKVLIIERMVPWQELIERILRNAGYEVVSVAKTREEALEAIDRILELGVKIVTMGYLEGTTDEDKQKILAAIKAIDPEVKTIGMAGINTKGVDIDLTKSRIEILPETVAET